MFLRAIKARCITPVEQLRDETGRLNVEKLSIKQPDFQEAVENWLKWFVIHHQAHQVWPKLLPLIGKALNTQAQGGQSEVEVMLAMHSMMQTAIAKGETPNSYWVVGKLLEKSGVEVPDDDEVKP